MEKKRSIGVTVFGIAFILISVITIIDFIINSNEIGVRINIFSLVGWTVPAVFGIGILKLNDIFRGLTIAMSAMFVILKPIHFIFIKNLLYKKTGYELSIFDYIDFKWSLILFFSLCAIYFFTRPKVKEQFK